MKLRVYQEPAEKTIPNRIQSHVEYGLALGEGGATAWSMLSIDDNLSAIEAALAAIDVDLQKLHQARSALPKNMEHSDDPQVWKWQHDMRQAENRLELHVWRRCFHLTQRMRTARLDQPSLARFMHAVLTMQSQMQKCDRPLQGHLSIEGIIVRSETSSRIMQLFAECRGASHVPSISH